MMLPPKVASSVGNLETSTDTQAFKMAIQAALGRAPEEIELGQLQRFATSDRRGDKAGWCKLFEDGRTGVFGDFRTGKYSVWSASRNGRLSPADRAELTQRLAQIQAKRQEERAQLRSTNAARNESIWSQTKPVVDGDPVSLYLRRRGLLGPIPVCLRLHPNLTYWDDEYRGTWPAMIAPLVHPSGKLLALHRTYLTADGRKAPVPTVKKLTGTAGNLNGACIPLHETQGDVLGIAEGIETAQAAHLASGLPTVAAYCAANLATYVWPPNAKRIVVFADSDSAGLASARQLKERAVHVGLSVSVLAPRTPGTDWCDVWAQGTSRIRNDSEITA